MSLQIAPHFRPALDPGFVPAILWNRAYRERADTTPDSRSLSLALCRADGTAFRWDGRILPAGPAHDPLTNRYVERLVKFLLWQKGGSRLLVAGADDVARFLEQTYAEGGARSFDRNFIGTKIFGEPVSVRAVAADELPAANDDSMTLAAISMAAASVSTSEARTASAPR